jgi:hypothetical protein
MYGRAGVGLLRTPPVEIRATMALVLRSNTSTLLALSPDPQFSCGFRIVGGVVGRIRDRHHAVARGREGVEYRYLRCLVSMTSTLPVPRSAR